MKPMIWVLIAHDIPYYMTKAKHPDLDYGKSPKGTGRCWRLKIEGSEEIRRRIYIHQQWNIETHVPMFLVTCNIDGQLWNHFTTESLRSAKVVGERFLNQHAGEN